MAKRLTIHPAADHVPEMGKEEFEAFTLDIKQNGLDKPVEIYEGKILDGRHRYRALIRLKMFDFDVHTQDVTKYLKDQNISPLAYIALQEARRHQSAGQRAIFAAKHIQKLDAAGERTETQDMIAKLLGVKPRTLERANRVLRDGPAEEVSQVESGEVSLRAADQAISNCQTAEPEPEVVEEPVGQQQPEPSRPRAAESSVDAIKSAKRAVKEAYKAVGRTNAALIRLMDSDETGSHLFHPAIEIKMNQVLEELEKWSSWLEKQS